MNWIMTWLDFISGGNSAKAGRSLLLLFLALTAGGAEMREWTDVNGRTIQARLISFSGEVEGSGVVFIQLENGHEYEVPVERLSAADKAWLRANVRPTSEAEADDDGRDEFAMLPDRYSIRIRPVVQKGAYCVPASAEIIARFHRIPADQDMIAKLSSEGSLQHEGTDPRDMAVAMNNFGLSPSFVYWERGSQDFEAEVLPLLKRWLVQQGPVYVSFYPGVFGETGHGCVLIGYNDRTRQLQFYNPWGNEFPKSFEAAAREIFGAVGFELSGRDGQRDPELGARVREVVSRPPGGLEDMLRMLRVEGLEVELRLGVRRDAREDRRFAVRLGRDEGRNFLYYGFNRSPVLIITEQVDEHSAHGFALIELAPGSRNNFHVWRLTENGWVGPAVETATGALRNWASLIELRGQQHWDLPLIDVRGVGGSSG